VNVSLGHQSLAFATLQAMKCSLHFNMCNLQTSYLPNDKVPGLDVKVQNAIPTHLSYSCRFWAAHLQETMFDAELLHELQAFVHSQYLYWLEVLSLCNKIDIVSPAMVVAADWTEVSGWVPDVSVQIFIKDLGV
jgi:hypothetical protein